MCTNVSARPLIPVQVDFPRLQVVKYIAHFLEYFSYRTPAVSTVSDDLRLLSLKEHILNWFSTLVKKKIYHTTRIGFSSSACSHHVWCVLIPHMWSGYNSSLISNRHGLPSIGGARPHFVHMYPLCSDRCVNRSAVKDCIGGLWDAFGCLDATWPTIS